MPLNKAQLMEVPGGPGITGAVKSGTGITISGDGTISVNPATNVTQLIAGTNITLNPANGFGAVTITAGGGGGGTITAVNAGTGLSGGGTSGSVTLSNSGVTGLTAGANITLSGSTGNVTITAAGGGGGGTITGVNAGTGLSGGGTSGTVTLSNSGVTSLNAGSNITLSGSTGAITISAAGGGSGGVPSFSAGSTGFTPASATTSAVTLGGVLNITNGGTGSSTKNFVDLSTTQQIFGEKFFNAPEGVHAKGFNNLPTSSSGFGFTGTKLLVAGQTEAVMSTFADPDKYFRVDNAFTTTASNTSARAVASVQYNVEAPFAVVSVAWTVVSDARLKTDVANFPPTLVDQYKAAFKQLQFVTYKWDDDLFEHGSYPTQIGLIAQDVETIEPDFIDTMDLSDKGSEPASPYFEDTKVLKNGLTTVSHILLQRVIQELDDLRSEFDAYVLAHP